MNAMTDSRAVTTPVANTPRERPAGEVSQKKLAKYQRLQEKQKKTKEKLDRMRKTLLAAESFEPGPLVCYRDQRSTKTLSQDKLRRIVGQEALDDILERISPTISWWVTIRKGVWRKG